MVSYSQVMVPHHITMTKEQNEIGWWRKCGSGEVVNVTKVPKQTKQIEVKLVERRKIGKFKVSKVSSSRRTKRN